MQEEAIRPLAAPAAQPIGPGLAVLLGALIALTPLSIDMYLPALPTIARDFGAPTGTVQYTLAAYFIGMAIGQAFFGPLSDRFGRKAPLYGGLVLHTLASAGCALAGSVESLILLRLLQAVGSCATMVVLIAMVRDLFDQRSSARVMSRLILVIGLAPIVAPSLGAWLLTVSSWRGIFWLLVAAGAAGLAAVHFALPESLPPARRQAAGSIGTALRAYGGLLREPRFMGFTLANAFSAAAMFAYIAGAPFVLTELHGLSAQAFGWVFGLIACGLMGASQLNHWLLSRWTSDQLLSIALVVMAAMALVLLFTGATGAFGLAGLVLPLFAVIGTRGLINPNATAGAMAGVPDRAGTASALQGVAQSVAAMVAGALVGLFNNGSALPMVAVMAVCSCAALLCQQVLVRSDRHPGRGVAADRPRRDH